MLSERAYEVFDGLVAGHWRRLSRPVHHLFIRIAYQANTTSLAAGLSNGWALNQPALALVRIRLEQTIVCSYLVHEDESAALRPFVAYISIRQYKGLRAAMEGPALEAQLAQLFDLSDSEADAANAQRDLTPGFTLERDTFQRSWTELDLRSMAKRRDVLANAKAPLRARTLESHYLSFYKVASSVIHADASSLSYAFLDLFQVPGAAQPVLMAIPSWAAIVAAATAYYDLLDCVEILTWLGISAEPEFHALFNGWSSARDKYLQAGAT